MVVDASGRTVQNLSVVRGDTPTVKFQAQDTAGDNLDLSTYTTVTGKLTVSPDNAPADETDELFEVAATVTPASGMFAFALTTSETLQTPDTYFYDIQVTLDGAIKTVATGSFTVEPDITDAGL